MQLLPTQSISNFKFKKSHNYHESSHRMYQAHTGGREPQSQKQHVEKGGTMCRSKIAGQVQAEGTRRQEDGATQDQKSLGGAGELVLTTEVGTALLALCHIQC